MPIKYTLDNNSRLRNLLVLTEGHDDVIIYDKYAKGINTTHFDWHYEYE